jgi:hypothetical protein
MTCILRPVAEQGLERKSKIAFFLLPDADPTPHRRCSRAVWIASAEQYLQLMRLQRRYPLTRSLRPVAKFTGR